MENTNTAKRLNVLRAVSLIGCLAILAFDQVMDWFAPDEPDMTLIRAAVGVACVLYFVGTFISAHVRRHAESWILLLVILFTGSWLYNTYVSQFSFPITITLFNVVLGCSLAFRDRRLIALYLIVIMFGVVNVLVLVEQPAVNPAILLTAFSVTCGLCYFVLGSWLKSQDELELKDEDLDKTQSLAQVGGWTLTVSKKHLTLSDSALDVLSLDRQSLLRWSDFLELFHADSRSALEQAVRGACENGERFDLELQCVGTDLQAEWLRLLGGPDDSERSHSLLRGMLQDISHHKQHEQELISAAETAEQALATRSRFLANMSHEIRTPMNGIIGMASLLRTNELNAEQQEMVDTIHDSGASLLTVLNDILDYSKIDAGRIELEEVVFSVRQIVSQTMELLAHRTADKDLALVQEIDDSVPESLVGDITRFRQVLSNLVANAIKFTTSGEVRVVVKGTAQGQTCLLTVAVQDTGVGIETDKQKALFDAFTQVDVSTTRLYGGTGLGLSISRELVELMGGALMLRSEQNVGSTFTFTLPLAYPEHRDNSNNICAVTQPADAELDARLKILLAEDNPVNQKVALKILEHLQLQADLAQNGEEAVAAAMTQSYDVILMDVQMPIMDGMEATRLIRELPHSPYIIAMTANTMAGDADTYFAAGMDAHLPKPVSVEALELALRHYATLRSEA